jgi:hypothetical protein
MSVFAADMVALSLPISQNTAGGHYFVRQVLATTSVDWFNVLTF